MLKINNLSFRYKASKPLFSNLSLELSSGNIYGLLGKNGAGKSTLLKIICGLLFAQHGTCTITGIESKARHPEILENIFFIPEEFYMPPITIQQYYKMYSPFYKKFDYKTFIHHIKKFNIPQNKKLTNLSYGQKKTFLVIFGISTNSSLLILDEPTNGFDIPCKSYFRKLITSALSEDKTFIISTHQVRDLENIIDPIIILDDGEILLNQSIHEISKRLSFQQQHIQPPPSDTIHYEKNISGYMTITENKTNFESTVNLETLFNAAIANKTTIKRIFNEVKHA